MWIVFSLLAAFTAACVVTLTKIGVRSVSPSVAFAIQTIPLLLVTWTLVLVRGRLPELAQLDRRTWGFLAVAGVLTAFSSLFSFQALKLGPAAGAGTLDKVSLVFVLLLAVVVLKERLTWQVVVGAGLMLAGALLIAFSRQPTK